MKKGIGWPIAMTVVLATVVVVNIWVMKIAGSDPSFVIEPDYYRKAVAWDSSMHQARRNAELGWTVVPSLAAADASGMALLTVQLADSLGVPVNDAVIVVSALFVGRALDVQTLTMGPDGSSGYTVALPVSHTGLWELRIEATRAAERFTAVKRVTARHLVSGVP